MGRRNQVKQPSEASGPPGLDFAPHPSQFGFPFMPMAPHLGFCLNDACATASEIDDSNTLSYKNAELQRQNLELKAEIEWMMGCNAMAQTNSRLQHRRKQFILSKQGKPHGMAYADDTMSRTASGGTTTSYTSWAFTSEADETPKSRSSRMGRRIQFGKSKADADEMSRVPSYATSTGYPTEGSVLWDETPTSAFSRGSRGCEFPDEVEESIEGCTESQKIRKVRFLLRKVTEENFGDAKETQEREESKPAQPGVRSAMMMWNIPKEYTRANVTELLDQQGFNGLYQLVYVPTNMSTELNYSYAFICLTTEEHAERFKNHFNGFKDWMVASDKVCEVCFNETLQTTEEHIERYKDSPMMHESVDDRFRPALFENGQRIPFPEPSKEIRAPRRKKGNKAKTDEQTA